MVVIFFKLTGLLVELHRFHVRCSTYINTNETSY